MEQIPEDCMGHIFSFSSPLEACRMCLVSRVVQSVLHSDTVWENFLPYDYKDIKSRLVFPIEFSSKKELFYKLCKPRLTDKGTKIFWLDNRTGKKCYVLGARELSIAWSNHPLYWSWKPLAGSRFAEAAELRTIWWLEIQGSFKSSALSPNTTYQVNLIVQIANRAYGLDKLPSEISGKHKTRRGLGIARKTEFECRKMGMIEIILGEFYNSGDVDEEVKMSLREVKGVHLKGGLVVEGMEFKALNDTT